MFLACRSPGDLHLQNECVNVDTVNSSKFTTITFLLVEPDAPCAVIVCGTTHGIILGCDVLELLRGGLFQHPEPRLLIKSLPFCPGGTFRFLCLGKFFLRLYRQSSPGCHQDQKRRSYETHICRNS